MSPASDKSGSSVFETGKYTTALVKVEAETSCLGKNKASSLTVAPPKQLLIATPSDAEAGEFPVLLLLHGYLLYNSFYSQLMQHIASHGFIVIAPQVSYLIMASNVFVCVFTCLLVPQVCCTVSLRYNDCGMCYIIYCVPRSLNTV